MLFGFSEDGDYFSYNLTMILIYLRDMMGNIIESWIIHQ